MTAIELNFARTLDFIVDLAFPQIDHEEPVTGLVESVHELVQSLTSLAIPR